MTVANHTPEPWFCWHLKPPASEGTGWRERLTRACEAYLIGIGDLAYKQDISTGESEGYPDPESLSTLESHLLPLFLELAAQPKAPSPTAAEAEAAFARIDEDHVDEQLRCVSCGCDDGHKPTCDMLTIKAALAPRGSGKWHLPSEEPDCAVGDCIVGVVEYRYQADAPLQRHLTILAANEGCWENDEGYSFGDLEFWAYERDLLPPPAGEGV